MQVFAKKRAVDQPAPALWTPLDEPSLRLWLDASDASTITTSNGNVTEWQDKSSSNIVFTPDGDSPTLGPNSLNFAGGFLKAVTRLGLPADPELAVYVIADPSVAGTVRVFDLGSGAGRPYVILSTFEYAWRYGNGNAIFNGANGGNEVLLSALRLPGFRGDNRMRVDGYELALNSFVDGPTTVTTELTEIAPGWEGSIKEVIVCASASAESTNNIEGFLANKHNRLLPLTHPYRNAPPTL